MIIYAGTLRVAEEDRDRFIAVRLAQIEAARAKPGVLAYSISADALDPGVVQVFECYSDEESLTAHESKHHRRTEVTVLDMDICRYETPSRTQLRLPNFAPSSTT